MGCNCKNDNIDLGLTNEVNKEDIPIGNKILITVIKTFMFLIGSVVGTILVIPFTIYMLFKVIYFNDSVDVTSGLVNIGKALRGKDKDDEDDDYDDDEYDDDEYELEDVEVIK